ncbi:MAG TPA: hypothetical protein VGF15_05590 [Solirubrobacteraceae bacterium]
MSTPDPDPGSGGAPVPPAPKQERPELAVAGAFAGGLLIALLLRRGRS